MGINIGKFIRRATTPAKPLRGVLGNSFLDEIGAIGGFLVGGPAGAAAGSSLGALGGGADLKGAALSGIKAGGVAALPGIIGGGGVPGAGAISSAGGKLGAGVQSAKALLPSAGGVGGMLKTAGNWALKNPGAVIGAGSLISGTLQNRKANQMQQEAVDMARSQWDSREPLRTMGLQQLLGAQAPNLTDIFRDTGNPYYR